MSPDNDHDHFDPDAIAATLNRATGRSIKIAVAGLVLSICFGVGFGLWLGNTTKTANQSAQQISTAKTVAAQVKTQAAEVKTQAAQTKAKADANEKVIRKTYVGLKVVYRAIRGQRVITGAGRRGAKGAIGPGASAAQIAAQVKVYCSGDPSPCAGPAGPSGANGTDGANTAVTDEQIQAGIVAYCQANGCKPEDGKDGTNGTDGQNATDAQVAQAVQSYCDGRGGCVAAPVPPTQEQVNAALAAYCSANPAACQAPAPAAPVTP